MRCTTSQHGRGRTSLGEGAVSTDQLRHCGEGTVIEPGVRVFFGENVSLGKRVYVGHGVILHGYHDGVIEIGDDVWIGPGAYLHGAGGLHIGDSVGIGPAVVVLTSSHADTDASIPVMAEQLVLQGVRIESGADVGARCVILPGTAIGERAVVGAGSVVSRDLPAESVCYGVPARVVRLRATRRSGCPEP